MRGRVGRGRWLAVVLAWVAPVAAQPPPKVCLNEFLASNSTSLANDKGNYEDWVELYNPDPAPVDIGGMFLTDDPNQPTKWPVPDAAPELTTLAPGGYLLIWADGGAGGTGLHANFKLSSEGEELALYDTDGATLVDGIVFARQSSDVSFGRYPDGGAEWSLLTVPTPGVSNASAWAGSVADVQFSVEHGFYDEPFDVTLSSDTPGARIWYTRDGTLPQRMGDGRWDALPYDQPLRIDRMTCLRAVAVKPGWKDSGVASCTYIFLDDIPAQLEPVSPGPTPVTPPGRGRASGDGQETSPAPIPSRPPADPALREALKAIPSVCIVMDPNDFSDPVRGINANPTRRGVEWERPASIEWLDPAGRLSWQVNAALRIHGGVSRNSGRSGKHSLRMLFKSQYGPAVLDAPLFEDCPVTRFDSLVLRCTLHDSWTGSMGASPQYMRDQFSRDTMRDMGRLTPYGRPVHVYINGQYWGLYILTERPDDGFAAAHLGGSKDQYDALKAKSVSDPDPAVVEAVAGDLQAWTALFACDHALFGEDVAPTAQPYAGPIDLTQSVPLKARVWRSGTWSALTQAVFAVGPVRENLRITELMYHPQEPNEEYIEMANIGAEPIHLNLVRFVDGIDFAFPSLVLAPGQTTLVVQDSKAFTDRYGRGPSVAGEYGGSLSNAGERLRLQDAVGNVIQDFRYADTWYPSTDGRGHALERRDPLRQDPLDLSHRDCWQASPHEGGSPGILE